MSCEPLLGTLDQRRVKHQQHVFSQRTRWTLLGGWSPEQSCFLGDGLVQIRGNTPRGCPETAAGGGKKCWLARTACFKNVELEVVKQK